ncbi:hypothetical protein [Streptomyces sp. NBC_01497]|uniref:hypothetical protein n=1 Tax=Streptomyces sp. NBC_01497 TaxID=2903885 RepID=UPI002E35CDCD|nr:hypothetical protein [Streptomyces sp. NBC_01497]
MLTHTSTNLQLQSVRAADLRRDAASYRMSRQAREAARAVRHAHRHPARTGALREQLGWSLVQLGLRLVDRPAGHHLVRP